MEAPIAFSFLSILNHLCKNLFWRMTDTGVKKKKRISKAIVSNGKLEQMLFYFFIAVTIIRNSNNLLTSFPGKGMWTSKCFVEPRACIKVEFPPPCRHYFWTKFAPGHTETEPAEKHLDSCMCLSITTFNQKPWYHLPSPTSVQILTFFSSNWLSVNNQQMDWTGRWGSLRKAAEKWLKPLRTAHILPPHKGC